MGRELKDYEAVSMELAVIFANTDFAKEIKSERDLIWVLGEIHNLYNETGLPEAEVTGEDNIISLEDLVKTKELVMAMFHEIIKNGDLKPGQVKKICKTLEEKGVVLDQMDGTVWVVGLGFKDLEARVLYGVGLIAGLEMEGKPIKDSLGQCALEECDRFMLSYGKPGPTQKYCSTTHQQRDKRRKQREKKKREGQK